MKEILTNEQTQGVILRYLAGRESASEEELVAACCMEKRYLLMCAVREMAYAGALNVSLTDEGDVAYHKPEEVANVTN